MAHSQGGIIMSTWVVRSDSFPHTHDHPLQYELVQAGRVGVGTGPRLVTDTCCRTSCLPIFPRTRCAKSKSIPSPPPRTISAFPPPRSTRARRTVLNLAIKAIAVRPTLLAMERLLVPARHRLDGDSSSALWSISSIRGTMWDLSVSALAAGLVRICRGRVTAIEGENTQEEACIFAQDAFLAVVYCQS